MSGKTKKKRGKSTSGQDHSKELSLTELEVFRDLDARFILNCPVEGDKSFNRIFHQLNLAWWFYLDHVIPKVSGLKSYKFPAFCRRFFELSPLLSPFLSRVDELFDAYMSYKASIPRSGTIILNKDLSKVLLVRGIKSKAWTFPCGKRNINESSLECAIRETFEETGFDCSAHILRDTGSLFGSGTITQFFVVPGISEAINFAPQTIGEVEEIKWFSVKQLHRKPRSYGVREHIPILIAWIRKNSSKAFSADESDLTSEDVSNEEDIFSAAESGWAAKDMFKHNEELFGIARPESLDPQFLSDEIARVGFIPVASKPKKSSFVFPFPAFELDIDKVMEAFSRGLAKAM
jgi:mRNA-decapping enzyme subunit 2